MRERSSRGRSPTDERPHDRQASDRILRTGLALLSATSLTWMSSLTMLLVMPRALGAAGLGVYATAGTAVGLVAMLASCGMSQVTIRRVARRPAESASIVAHAVVARALLWGVLVILGIPLAFAMFAAGEPRLVLALVTSRAAVSSLGAVASDGLQGLQSLGRFAIFRSAVAMATELLSVVLLLSGHGVIAVITLGLGTSLVRGAVAWAMLASRVEGSWRVQVPAVLAMPRAGFSFLTLDIALLVYGGAGTLILANVLGAPAVGPFALANRIVSVVTTTPSIVAGAVLPALAAAHLDPPRFRTILANALRTVVAGAFPMGAGLALLAPQVVHVLGGPTGYEETIPVLRIAAVAVPLIGLDVILATALLSLNRQRSWAVWTAVMAAVSFPLTYLGVVYAAGAWSNGGIGAAMAPALLEGGMCVVALRMLGSTVDRGLLVRHVLKGLAGVAVMCAVVAAVLELAGLLAAIAAGAVVYGGVALLTGLVSLSDLASLRGAVLERGRPAAGVAPA